jgi:hypothetical protein
MVGSRMLLLWVAALHGCVVGGECDQDAECASDELCWVGRCEPATDRWWNVDIHAAEVGWAHPDGAAWDTDLSPPDLFVEFGLDIDTCLTSYVPDSYEPVWYESCDFFVPYDPVFSVGLWDFDTTVDELATELAWLGTHEFTSLARTAGQEVGFTDESGSIVLWLEVWPE